MKNLVSLSVLSLAALFVAGNVFAEEDSKVDLSKVKCVVSGKAINPEATAEYKDATVYFCCNGCPNAFAKDTEKFADKANHQLVATKQAKQKACPLSGKDTDATKTVAIEGVEVAFCCGNCVKAVSGKEGEARIAMVFSDKNFKKGFKVDEKK